MNTWVVFVAFFQKMMAGRGMRLEAEGNAALPHNREKGLKLIRKAAKWHVRDASYACAAYCADTLLKNKKVKEAAEVHLRIGRATKDYTEAVKHFMKAAEIVKRADKNLAVKAYLFAINTAYRAFDEKSAGDAVVEAGELLKEVGRESPHACEIGKWTQLIGSEEMFVHFACNAGLEKAMEALGKVDDQKALESIAKRTKHEEVARAAFNRRDVSRVIEICTRCRFDDERLARIAAGVLAEKIPLLSPKGLEMVTLLDEEHAEKAVDTLRNKMLGAARDACKLSSNELDSIANKMAQYVAAFARVMTRSGQVSMCPDFLEAVEKFVEMKRKRCGESTPALNEDCEKLVGEARKLERAVQLGRFRIMRLYEFLKQLERLAVLPEDLGAEDWERNVPGNEI